MTAVEFFQSSAGGVRFTQEHQWSELQYDRTLQVPRAYRFPIERYADRLVPSAG